MEANTKQFLELEAKGALLTRTDQIPVSRGSKNWYGVRCTFDESWGVDIPNAIVGVGEEAYILRPDSVEGNRYEFTLPAIALAAEHFSLSFYSGNLRTSLPLWIATRPSGYTDSPQEPIDPPPSLYEQISQDLEHLQSTQENAQSEAELAHANLSERIETIETGLADVLTEVADILIDHEERIAVIEQTAGLAEEELAKI